MRGAALSAGAVLLLTLLALSPLARVHTVVWTGTLRAPAGRSLAFEEHVLGQPLLLLPERSLGRVLGLPREAVRVRLRRHLPHTLEVRVEPRRAVALLGPQTALDARGRVLAAVHAGEGLPRLDGFALEAKGKRLEPRSRALLRDLVNLLDTPLLVPAQVQLRDDGEMQLVLAESGTRVRADAAHLDEQLLKLRIWESSQDGAPLPQSIDLRFRDQIVVRAGGGHARAHRR